MVDLIGEVVLTVVVRDETNGLSALAVVFGLVNVVVRAVETAGADRTRDATDDVAVALGTFGLAAATVLGFAVDLKMNKRI